MLQNPCAEKRWFIHTSLPFVGDGPSPGRMISFVKPMMPLSALVMTYNGGR